MKRRSIAYDSSFHKQFKKVVKNNKELENKTISIMEMLQVNIFDSKLATHKLSGELKKYYACKISFNLRIIFYTDDDFVYLIDIGSHDDVY